MSPKTRLLPRQLLLGRLGSRLPWWTCGPAEESLLTSEEFEGKLQPVAYIFEEYKRAGGDPERLKVAIFGLVPVVVTPPPSRRALEGCLRRCIKALDEVIALPGPVMGKEEGESTKRYLEFLLHSKPDLDAYYGYWGPHEELVNQYDRYLNIGRPQAIRTGQIGRKKGSTIGQILAVLAREFEARFGSPRWSDLLKIALAISHRDLIPPTTTTQHLMNRARPYRKKCEALHRYLFEQPT